MAKGYIIIKHQIFGEITDEEVLQILPKEDGIPIYKIFDIKREIISMDKVHQLDSVEFRIYQKNLVDNEIKPYLGEHPDYKVLYFGKATIPLALHLGYCFGSWQEVEVYLFHREQMNWEWNNDDDRKSLPATARFVEEKFNAPIDVIYKVEATYLTQDEEMDEVVENANKIVSLSLDTPGKDVFRNQDQLKAFAHQFSVGLDSLANFLPDTDKIHLFPTVPVGLAFLMGTKINPLLSKPIVTYQYDANRSPKNEQVLILQETPQSEANMTDADKEFISTLKFEFKAELENKIAPFAASKHADLEKQTNHLSWVRFILPVGGDYDEIEKGFWKAMPDLTKTILRSSSLSLETDKADDGFYIGENDEWQINDRFIFNIMNRLDRDKGKIFRALRLFIFHEALHIHQNLTNYTARNIGRFPRVLEEADYVADVWAMIHEYAYSKLHYNQEAKEEKSFFKEMIDVATKTMWAFDDLDPNTEEMQIRRVNRYLIWYWNYLQIEDRNCKTVQDTVNILANKPLIEIRGLDIRAQSQRTIFRLIGFKREELEIGYFQLDGKILRASNAGGFQLDEVVKGFRERKGEKILAQLKKLVSSNQKLNNIMLDIRNHDQIANWLDKIGEALDLSIAQYKAVEDRYLAVANHLSSETSILKVYNPEIKPQGSFLLGTMIKPIMEDDELDIDLVCRLTGKNPNWTQFNLKEAVGDQLKESEVYKKMLDEEGNRCWTLLYAESTKFHMDILPAIVGRNHFTLLERSYSSLNMGQINELSINITDKRLPNFRTEVAPGSWPKSNPFGYAAWFQDRASINALEGISLRESIEPLPVNAGVKEPLKRIIQLLKRHRDNMFGGDEHKPISIIITTLAAKAYKKETDLAIALLSILGTMDSFIETKFSYELSREVKWISNPVNDVENFADKWPYDSVKEENFFSWLTKAREDFAILASGSYTQIFRMLKATIGTKAVHEGSRASGMQSLISESFLPANFDPSILSVSHREKARWAESLTHNVEIHANYKLNKKSHTMLPNTIVPKDSSIYFVASTNVPRPFEVYWQVVNTGEEARMSNDLRGGIHLSKTLGVGGLRQKEVSAFSGNHWIECFIVKNNICVARSYEFLVQIK